MLLILKNIAPFALLPAAALAAAVSPVPTSADRPASLAAGDDAVLTETYCYRRDTVTETLHHDFAEEPRLAALTGTGMTMELWASDLLGSWTMVHHGQDGISCIVTSGMDWTADTDPVAMIDHVLAQTVHQS